MSEQTALPTNEAPAHEPGKFDPNRHLIKVQGGRMYLPVSARLQWFREEHPDWSIETTPVKIVLNPENPKQSPYAIFKCVISDAEGRVISTAHKMEDARGFGDFLEKSETGSIGRALAGAGYGTQFAPDVEDGTAYAGQHVIRPNAPNNGPRQSGPPQRLGGPPPQGGNQGRQEAPPPQGRPNDTQEKNAREKAFHEFAQAAHEAGFDVTSKHPTNPEKSVFSNDKLAALIVEITNATAPDDVRGWRPAVGIMQAAKAGLGPLAKTRGMKQKSMDDDYDDTGDLADPFAE